MKFTITAYGIGGQVFKTKTYASKPSLKVIRRLKDQWDNAYGAYLRYETIEHN